MYFVMYCLTDEMICEDIDQVADRLTTGWKLYGFVESKQLAESLLHECKHY